MASGLINVAGIIASTGDFLLIKRPERRPCGKFAALNLYA